MNDFVQSSSPQHDSPPPRARSHERLRAAVRAAVCVVLLGSVMWLLRNPLGGLPPLGLLVDVWHGAYSNARAADEPAKEELSLQGLSAPVKVYRDERGVPHIFAQNDRDAVLTVGYLTAKDRLFQMEFQTRAAAGRLSEIIGEAMVENDKYLRRTGMMLGAERSWAQILDRAAKGSTSATVGKTMLEAYSQGVNAYIASLGEPEMPFEFRLLGVKRADIEAWTPLKTLLINQLMALDLAFTIQTTDIKIALLETVLGADAVAELYPDHSPMPLPHNPEPKGVMRPASVVYTRSTEALARSFHDVQTPHDAQNTIPQTTSRQKSEDVQLAEHLRVLSRIEAALAAAGCEQSEGKGSNNWVVAGARTQSGKPLLAGDPHLNLSMPSIWYELHIVTPAMNVYGVTIPGAPLVIIGFNDAVAWSPTNTGADVLDFYSITFDGTQQQRYRHNGEWKPVREEIRPIRVKGKPDVLDTMRFTHWGPVITQHKQTLAIRWTAHEASSIIEAIWGFNHARNWQECSEAQRKWDVPAQNIVYADRDGNIALRSCGVYPIRQKGHGRGIHNGSTDEGAWTGYVPFDSVPASLNPERGWLQSANQEPVPPDYPYYLGYNWTNPWRAMRISEVLATTSTLKAADMQALQLDVQVQQFRQMQPLMKACGALERVADSTKHRALKHLLAWNGVASQESKETLLFKLFWDTFTRRVWDELPDSLAGEVPPVPSQDVLVNLVLHKPDAVWFDAQHTPEREHAAMICQRALLEALDSLVAKYGTNAENWKWGRHHTIVLRHLLRSSAVKPLWRGPYPFQGFSSTVLPAGGMQSTHSASWRMVADFARGKPEARGVFPGGPSGNPFSKWYDSQVQDWLAGRLYTLYKPASAQEFSSGKVSQELIFKP
jgi:penicillin amidase